MNDNLPPGWDCMVDEKTGRYYYVNHLTKTTTWDDPRHRHRPFQTNQNHFTNMSVEHIPLQEFRSVRMSPLSIRGNKVQDSSLTIVPDTDEAVSKINTMFPTVPETHIRMLMKNCRYMKSIFPQAEETVILEILQGNENNIQKASDILKEMGFDKKDTVKAAQQKLDAKKEEESIEKEEVEKPAPPPPRLKTTEEKAAMKEKLKEKYPDVVEQLISIALESVDFDENRANQILQIMVQEDTKKNEETNKLDVKEEEIITELDSPAPASTIPISQSRMSIKSLLKNERNEKEKITFNRVIENDENYRSSLLSNTRGPNSDFIKGANENLLLEDYVKWQGPNASLHKGSQGLAKGPNKSLISNRSYTPCGPNAELRKGPKFGLATGSIFSQMKTVIVGEARGK